MNKFKDSKTPTEFPNEIVDKLANFFCRKYNGLYIDVWVDYQDLRQDILLKMWEHHLSFREGGCQYSTWMYFAGQHVCTAKWGATKTKWKHNKGEIEISKLDSAEFRTPKELVVQSDMESVLMYRDLYKCLTTEEGMLLRMREEEGMTLKDIGFVFNIHLEGVRLRLVKIKTKLKGIIDGTS